MISVVFVTNPQQVIKALIHIIVASFVFLSSTGLLINSHYCQGEFVKASFFFSFGSCCGDKPLESCTPKEGSCSIGDNHDHNEEEEDGGCCDNKSDYFKLEQDQQIQHVKFKPLKQLITWNPITPRIHAKLTTLDKRTFRFYNHFPPLIVFDRQVRLQTFLC